MECEHNEECLERTGTSSNVDENLMHDAVIDTVMEPEVSKNLDAPTDVEGQEVHPDKNKINNNKLTLGTDSETVREPVSSKFNSHDTTKDDADDMWITPEKKKKKNKSKNKETVPQATQVRRLPVKPSFKNPIGDTVDDTLFKIDTPKRKFISPITSVGKKLPTYEHISPHGKVNKVEKQALKGNSSIPTGNNKVDNE